MHDIPANAPATLGEAFAHINAVTNPTIDDLKLMVLLEAAGKGLYEDLARGTGDERVQALLRRNGREELAHAHRVSRAIGKLTGDDFPVPEVAENPYLAGPSAPPKALTRAVLASLAEAEFGGETLYEGWAKGCADPEAAALLRQNGREESEHGARLQEAAALLPA